MLSEIAQNIGVPAETLEEHEEQEYDHDSQDECGLDGQYKFDPVERESDYEVMVLVYVGALEKLTQLEESYGVMTTVQFENYVPSGFVSSAKEQKYWLSASRAKEAARVEAFICAVESLEALVVQHLFELLKANLAGTGYKLRQHISKAISQWSFAIRTASDRYNKLAAEQKNPAPVLEYSQVVSYTWLGKFELLKCSRHDILKKPWAVPSNRELAVKYFKVICAQEEIKHLYVEIRRLHEWVNAKDAHLLVMAEGTAGDEYIALEINAKYLTHRRVNNVHCRHLQQIYNLKGFSGDIKDNNSAQHNNTINSQELDNGDDEEDDFLFGEVSRMQKCLQRMLI
ncbi:hypothetical protein SERLADRAFT_444079 [Serpula lacrymans var. lacrymans S7.9]|uniref:Uncharacterized protein n=1 Tax=Serpula lacrymans var. lacrymans (strain S7.9) TaxID=578457 RepID=F8PEG1_SERL9|nr:uncharacterized protein SERLADRAFT_444079 [Serpula lacrymans var. lacrymans S7.9]EGO18493.1 hypothetical protein SERLADRAFT_444079 [Serpula lacrymans var. lacrymans S7.9]